MAVTLTSPVLGHDAGFVYTGPEEDWLLAEGYARRNAYTGPGVSNTGLTDVAPAKDPQLAANREPAPERDEQGREDAGPPDPAMTVTTTDDDPSDEDADYDFDTGSTNDDAPSTFTVEPNTLVLAGGAVSVKGQNLEGVTGITVGGTAATSVVVVDDSEVTAVFPAKTAGAYNVIVTNPTGSKTETAAVTYAA